MSKEAGKDHPGIKPDMKADWKKYEEDAIGTEDKKKREVMLRILAISSNFIKALSDGIHPIDVIKRVPAETHYVIMTHVIQTTAIFSVRGEEFRVRWNGWHDRQNSGIFFPWIVNILGREAQLDGIFDPYEPLTNSPTYLASVNELHRKIKAAASSKA